MFTGLGFQSLNGLMFENAVFMDMAKLKLGQLRQSPDHIEDISIEDISVERDYQYTSVVADTVGALRKAFKDSHFAAVYAQGKNPDRETMKSAAMLDTAPTLTRLQIETIDSWVEGVGIPRFGTQGLKTMYLEAAKNAGRNHGYSGLLEDPAGRVKILRTNGARFLLSILTSSCR